MKEARIGMPRARQKKSVFTSAEQSAALREVRSVQQGKILQFTYANGSATFTTPLDLADHILLFK